MTTSAPQDVTDVMYETRLYFPGMREPYVIVTFYDPCVGSTLHPVFSDEHGNTTTYRNCAFSVTRTEIPRKETPGETSAREEAGRRQDNRDAHVIRQAERKALTADDDLLVPKG
jgi:hypothetical protein